MNKYKVENIGKIKEGEKNGEVWKTLDVVLKETEGEYPNSFVANLFKKGEYVSVVEKFSENYPVETIVEAELKFNAKEYEGRYFQNVSIWNIKKSEDKDEVQYPDENLNPEDIPF